MILKHASAALAAPLTPLQSKVAVLALNADLPVQERALARCFCESVMGVIRQT